MRKLLTVVAVLTAGMLAPNAAAAFDLRTAELAGIKLYETEDQVRAVLQKRFGSGLKTQEVNVSRLIDGGERIGTINFIANDDYFSIAFAERAPPNKGNVVWSIQYSPTQLDLRADRAKFREEAIKKYGTPDREIDAQHIAWCAPPSPQQPPAPATATCRGGPSLELFHDGRNPVGTLMLSDASLSMEALHYAQAQAAKPDGQLH